MDRTDPPVDVRRLTAFTDDPAGGNPAGVVVAAALPDAGQMQRVAAAVGYSETAFLAPIPEGDDRAHVVRYFSPQAEVDFCGHATIAAGVLLGTQQGIGTYRLHTNVGVVPVEVARRADGRFIATLTSVDPTHREVPADVLRAALATFDWTTADVAPVPAPAEAFAGAWHLVVPLRSRQALAGMTYRFEELRALMLDRGLTTLQVIWRQDETTIAARNPFPVGGVVEDPATGAAAAALGGYLRDSGHLSPPVDLTIYQGEDLGRPSTIRVHVPTSGGIRVTGTAVQDPI